MLFQSCSPAMLWGESCRDVGARGGVSQLQDPGCPEEPWGWNRGRGHENFIAGQEAREWDQGISSNQAVMLNEVGTCSVGSC